MDHVAEVLGGTLNGVGLPLCQLDKIYPGFWVVEEGLAVHNNCVVEEKTKPKFAIACLTSSAWRDVARGEAMEKAIVGFESLHLAPPQHWPFSFA